MNKFRPSSSMARYKLRMHRRGVYETYNWRTHDKWYPAGWGINQRTLGDIFGRLHYLGSHAPAPIRAKWKKCERRFLDARVPRHASGRYTDTWSSARWL